MRFLTGYEAGFADGEVVPLVDGGQFLAREGFWAAYYVGQGLCVDEDGDIVFPSFEVAEETVHEVYDELTDPESWPVFTIPVSDSTEICVVVRNYEEDDGFDYVICREGLEASICIAAVEGCSAGAGISWPELRSVADRAPDPLRRAQALLLLAPIYGDGDHVEEACSAFEQALAMAGGNRDGGRLARFLGSDGLEGQLKWQRDESGVLWCDNGAAARSRRGADRRTERLNAVVSEILAPGNE